MAAVATAMIYYVFSAYHSLCYTLNIHYFISFINKLVRCYHYQPFIDKETMLDHKLPEGRDIYFAP